MRKTRISPEAIIYLDLIYRVKKTKKCHFRRMFGTIGFERNVFASSLSYVTAYCSTIQSTIRASKSSPPRGVIVMIMEMVMVVVKIREGGVVEEKEGRDSGGVSATGETGDCE
jgi:hypothetical protein